MNKVENLSATVVDPQTGEEVEVIVRFRVYEGEDPHAFTTRKDRGIAALKDYIKHKGVLPK